MSAIATLTRLRQLGVPGVPDQVTYFLATDGGKLHSRFGGCGSAYATTQQPVPVDGFDEARLCKTCGRTTPQDVRDFADAADDLVRAAGLIARIDIDSRKEFAAQGLTSTWSNQMLAPYTSLPPIPQTKAGRAILARRALEMAEDRQGDVPEHLALWLYIAARAARAIEAAHGQVASDVDRYAMLVSLTPRPDDLSDLYALGESVAAMAVNEWRETWTQSLHADPAVDPRAVTDLEQALRQAADASVHALIADKLGDAPFALAQVPTTPRLDKADYPTVHAWAQAEWQIARDAQVEILLARLEALRLATQDAVLSAGRRILSVAKQSPTRNDAFGVTKADEMSQGEYSAWRAVRWDTDRGLVVLPAIEAAWLTHARTWHPRHMGEVVDLGPAPDGDLKNLLDTALNLWEPVDPDSPLHDLHAAVRTAARVTGTDLPAGWEPALAEATA